MNNTRRIALEAIYKIQDLNLRSELLHSLTGRATCFDQVRAFHRLYECPIEAIPQDGLPTMDDDRLELRLELIREEFKELTEAAGKRDIVEVADALGDILYVTLGFAIEAGIDLVPVVDEIHASNMTKLAEDGSVVRRADGKVLKGPKYVRPDIRSVLFP